MGPLGGLSNIVGTFTLLQETLRHWCALSTEAGAVPLPARLDRRGVRLARRSRPVRAEFARFREQGVVRSPGGGLAGNL